MNKSRDAALPITLILVITAQALCVLFFLSDALADALPLGLAAFGDLYNMTEFGAVLSLVAAIVIESRYLMALLRRKSQLERSVSIAAGALQDVIDAHFQHWGLTPSEQDVAGFTIKGCSISEIAELRGSASGTVKSHLNAIYRKAGVTGRGGLLALLIEDLLAEPLVDAPDAAAQGHRSPLRA
jgi:DNA-binding CsgD family transcriptional regulator